MATELVEYRGLWFHPDTIETVRDILVTGNQYFRNRRFRIYYGNVETGQAWITESDAARYDVRSAGEIGYIGRSTGPKRVPLSVHNARSLGGGHILDHCIIRIETTRGREVVYSHPQFHYKEEEQVGA